MLVTITKAADMVGVTRATLYRHIDKKGISVQEDADGNPKIDTSELVRVYGDRIKPEGHSKDDTDIKQDDTRGEIVSSDLKTEVEVLRERLRFMEQSKGKSEEERAREREQLNEQISMLRERLEKAEDQQKRLTLLLTDQSQKRETGNEWQKSIKALETRIANQEKSAKEREEREQRILRQNKALKQALDKEKSKTIWQRLFG